MSSSAGVGVANPKIWGAKNFWGAKYLILGE